MTHKRHWPAVQRPVAELISGPGNHRNVSYAATWAQTRGLIGTSCTNTADHAGERADLKLIAVGLEPDEARGRLRAASEAPVTRIAQFDSHFINFSMPVLVCTVGANHAICVLALRTLRHFSVQSGLDCVLERPRPRLQTVNLGLAEHADRNSTF